MAKPTTAVLPLRFSFPAEPPPSPEHNASPPGLLWLAIVFPQLAVEAVADGRTGEPLAVIEEVGGRRFIHAVTEAVEQRGVVAGMTVSAACALCPELQVIPRDPQAEQRCLTILAQWAGQFTSWVSVQPPQALLLEVRGSLRLFGGLEALRHRVENELGNGPHRWNWSLAIWEAAAP